METLEAVDDYAAQVAAGSATLPKYRIMATTEIDSAELSHRERQILQLVVEGKSSTEISEILFLSPKTVETYRSRLMHKLDIKDLPALVKFAIQHGLTTV